MKIKYNLLNDIESLNKYTSNVNNKIDYNSDINILELELIDLIN